MFVGGDDPEQYLSTALPRQHGCKMRTIGRCTANCSGPSLFAFLPVRGIIIMVTSDHLLVGSTLISGRACLAVQVNKCTCRPVSGAVFSDVERYRTYLICRRTVHSFRIVFLAPYINQQNALIKIIKSYVVICAFCWLICEM